MMVVSRAVVGMSRSDMGHGYQQESLSSQAAFINVARTVLGDPDAADAVFSVLSRRDSREAIQTIVSDEETMSAVTTVITDPDTMNAVNALVNSEKAPEAFERLSKGDYFGAATALSGDMKAMSAVMGVMGNEDTRNSIMTIVSNEDVMNAVQTLTSDPETMADLQTIATSEGLSEAMADFGFGVDDVFSRLDGSVDEAADDISAKNGIENANADAPKYVVDRAEIASHVIENNDALNKGEYYGPSWA